MEWLKRASGRGGLLDEMAGDNEARFSVLSGMASDVPAGLAGIAGAVLPGPRGQGADWVRATQDRLSYTPRTSAGRQKLSDLGYQINEAGRVVRAVAQRAPQPVKDFASTAQEGWYNASAQNPLLAAVGMAGVQTLSPGGKAKRAKQAAEAAVPESSLLRPQADGGPAITPAERQEILDQPGGPSLLRPQAGPPATTLNVGLVKGRTKEPIDPSAVLNELDRRGIPIEGSMVRQSSTEPTLVVNIARPLNKREGDEISAAFDQEAIAQRIGDDAAGGELFGPKAQAWGPFNQGYFLDLVRRGSQTVRNPQRNANPGIYKSPEELLADYQAQYVPESPLLKEIYGTTRAELAAIAQSRKGNEAGIIRGEKGRSRPPQHVLDANTKENAQRINEAINYARRADPGSLDGGIGWYVMDPEYLQFVDQFGQEEGHKRFMRQVWLSSLESPGTAVPYEYRRGTAANMMLEQGRFDEWVAKGGLSAKVRGVEGLEAVPGRIGGKQIAKQQRRVAQMIEDGASMPEIAATISHKVGPYGHAQGVPETGFQTDLTVGDAHHVRNTGLADTRPASASGKKDVEISIAPSELKAQRDWSRGASADVGLEPTSWQGTNWTLFGPQTGVKTPLGAPRLELQAIEIGRAAKRLGVSPREAAALIRAGKAHAGFARTGLLAGIGGAGLLGAWAMSGDEAEEAAVEKERKRRNRTEDALKEMGL